MSLSLYRRVLLVGGRRCAALGRRGGLWRPALASPTATGMLFVVSFNWRWIPTPLCLVLCSHSAVFTHSPGLCYSSSSRDSEAEKVDEGLRLGDYPVLPWRSAQLNKQTGWWDNQDRRDKETIVREGSSSCPSLSPSSPPPIPPSSLTPSSSLPPP